MSDPRHPSHHPRSDTRTGNGAHRNTGRFGASSVLNNDDFVILPHDHPTVVGFRDLTDTHGAEIPGIDQETPWSEASLLAAEQAYARFSDAEADRTRALHEAFLGEGLVRLHGGSWVKLRAHTKSGEPSHGYGIHHEITDHIDVVTSLPSLARRLGTGSHWAVIYTSTAKCWTWPSTTALSRHSPGVKRWKSPRAPKTSRSSDQHSLPAGSTIGENLRSRHHAPRWRVAAGGRFLHHPWDSRRRQFASPTRGVEPPFRSPQPPVSPP